MQAIRASARPERAPTWLIYGLVGCVTLVIYILLPSEPAQHVIYPLFGCSAGIAILIGLKRNPHSDRRAWIAFSASQLVWAVGDVLNVFMHDGSVDGSTLPIFDDAIYLLGYPFLALFLIRMTRRQRGQFDWGGLIDALIAAVGVGILTLALAVTPMAGDVAFSRVERVAIAAFPSLDLLVLALVFRLMFGAGRPSVPILLVMVGSANIALASVLYELRSLHGFSHGGGFGDLGWLLSYIAFGAAALHPSMSAIGEQQAMVRSPIRRIVFLAPIALVGPVVLLLGSWRDVGVSTTPIVVGTSLLTALAFARVLIVMRESESANRRSRDIFESIHDAFCSLDRDWRFTFVNREAERLLKQPKADLLNSDIWTAFPPLNETPLGAELRRAMTERVTAEVVIRYEPLDGWFQVRIFPSAVGLSVYFVDVTEHERAKLALAASEARYRSVVENVPVAIYTVNCDDIESYGYLGPYVETLLGYTTDEFIADLSLWTRRIHPDDRERVKALGDETDATGRPFAAEYRMVTKDGRQIWVNDGAVLVRSESGTPLYWQGAVTDVTERKVAQEALATRDARFRSFVQQATDLISLLATDGTILYQSPAFERLLGYQSEQWIGRSTLSLIQSDDVPVVQRILEEIAKKPQESITFEARLMHADGSWRWMEATARNLAHDPEIGGIVVNSHDITERKQLEEDLRRREARHRALLDAIPDVMVRFDRHGTYLDVKTVDSVPLLHSAESLLGRTIAEMLPADLAGRATKAIELALDGRNVQTFEYRLELMTGPRDYESRVVAAGSDEVVALIRDVTRRKIAEARVQESEERLRLALEAAGIGAWDWHIQSDTVIWSATLCSMLGLPVMPRATSTRDYHLEFVHPDDREQVAALRDDMTREDSFGQIEYRAVRPDGEVCWLVDIGRLIEKGPDGEPIRSAGVTIDVTATKAAAAALRLRDSAIAATSSGVLIVDATGDEQTIIDANPAFERITGYARDEVIGRRVDFLFGPDTDDAAAATLNEAVSQGYETTITMLNYRKDGTTFWNELGLSPVQDGDGRLTNVVGIVNDVTKRNWAEHELRYQSGLLDTVSAAVIAITPDGAITHWNRHAETLYGWTRDEVIGLDVNFVTVGPAERETSLKIKEMLLAGETWEGEFALRRKDGSRVDVHIADTPIIDVSGKLVGIVGVSVDISDRKEIERQLAHQASHDALTGLPNRKLFTERLNRALSVADESGASVAVLFFDLDGFKHVNDSLGHEAGDRLLIGVAGNLADALEPELTLARFGGDEFTLLLPSVGTPQEVDALIERIFERLRCPILLAGRETYVNASIGVSFSSETLHGAEDLMRAADIALYAAKGAGRGTFRVFEPGMTEHLTLRLALEEELRRAIERNEFRLYYQPEIVLETGAVSGAEALIRWQHPTHGLLLPSAFIPIAEESDLINSIGAWAINEACQQVGQWHRLFESARDLHISVNLSARQLRQPEFVNQVEQAISDAGISPHQLTIEIAECAAITDLPTRAYVVDRLRALGVKLAFDDFGMGYSSLSNLRRWPVDILKVDRSFIGEMDRETGRNLVAAMNDLAHALGAETVAKGIETAEQLARLRSTGVERGQGYLFAEPLPPERFAFLLALEGPFVQEPRAVTGSRRNRQFVHRARA